MYTLLCSLLSVGGVFQLGGVSMMDWGSGFQLLFADGLWLDEGVEELRQEKKVTSPLSVRVCVHVCVCVCVCLCVFVF